MTLPRRLAAFLALSLGACAAAPPATAPVSPLPPAASTASAEDPRPPSDEVVDPALVRCGIDDRPRAILGDRDDGGGDRERAKSPPPHARFAPPPQPPGVVPSGPPAMPRATATLAPPRLVGGQSAPPPLSAAFAASPLDLDGCEALATVEDEGSYELALSLASGGTPLVVKPPPTGKPSAYVRCVMERACQLRGDASTAPGDVLVGVHVKWNFPKRRGTAKAPEGAQPPRTVFEARDDQNASKHAFYRALRELVRQDARVCGGQLDGTEARITLSLSKARTPRITATKVEPLAPGIAPEIEACIVERLTHRALAERPAGFVDTEVALLLTW